VSATAACLLACYALFKWQQRQNALARCDLSPFADRIAPGVVVGVLVAMMCCLVAINVAFAST
jgi:uncharacterized membrane protein YidH (DUF202 family)